MNHKSHELAYLTDLLRDFSANPELEAEQAITLIQAKHALLLHNIIFSSNLWDITGKDKWIPIFDLPRLMHRFLYKGILNNAGEYRKSTDPKNGAVYFGREREFIGTSPAQIESQTNEALTLLQPNEGEPIWNAAHFYQRFVQIHPFYDANGRIGRVIVSSYLDFHGLYMYWEVMKKNDQWLKRLNHCHRRYGSPSYDTYLGYHAKHWQKFIVEKEVIYSE